MRRIRASVGVCAAAFALLVMPFSAHAERRVAVQTVVLSPEDPLLNKDNLDQIKRHIIAHGRRCTYVNMYNDNPCWSLPPYMFYLNPDPGPDGHPQWNIGCDIRRGDFNTLVITDSASSVDPGSIEFRRAGAVAFRRYWGEVSPVEAGQSEAAFRTAVAAALKAVGER